MAKPKKSERLTSFRLNENDNAVIEKIHKRLGIQSTTEILRHSLRTCAWWYGIIPTKRGYYEFCSGKKRTSSPASSSRSRSI
jgi:hypothetical protein